MGDKPKGGKAVTAEELLKEYYDMEMNHVFCCSANYLMTIPKKGQEAQWRQAKERVELLESMLAGEYPKS